jgi:hypothetical protein
MQKGFTMAISLILLCHFAFLLLPFGFSSGFGA